MNGSAAILAMILEELRGINRKLDIIIGPSRYVSMELINDNLNDIASEMRNVDGERIDETLTNIASVLEDIKGPEIFGSVTEIYEKVSSMEYNLESIESKI